MQNLIGIAILIAILAVVHISVLRDKPKKARKLARTIRLRYCVYLVAAVIAGSALLFDAYDIVSNNYPHWQITVFLGSVIVALGWVVTNEISLNNSRKQHTITLVTTLVNNERRIADKQIINKYIPPYTGVLTPDTVDYEAATHELVQAIDRELNFYEFIAVGLDSGDLDPVICRRFLEVVVPSFVEQVYDYIRYWRAKDQRIWQYVIELVDKWSLPPT